MKQQPLPTESQTASGILLPPLKADPYEIQLTPETLSGLRQLLPGNSGMTDVISSVLWTVAVVVSWFLGRRKGGVTRRH